RSHRLCLGDKHHQPGRAGAGLLAEDQLQGRRPGEGGATLFVIEPEPYKLKLEQARAAQVGAQATLKQTEAEYERQAELASRQVASKQALDNATANRDSARARLKEAEVDTAQAALNLGYTEVKAPFDGIVTARQVSLGELVGANGPTQLATI